MLSLLDVVLPIASLLIYGLYHLKYFYVDTLRERTRMQTTRGVMDLVRFSWVKTNMGGGVVPVNTFRDLLNNGAFFGSVSIFIVFAVLGVAASQSAMCLPQPVYTCVTSRGGALTPEELLAATTCTPEARLFLAKLLAVAANFFLVFFLFTQMMRLLSNCAFLMNTKFVSEGVPVTADLVYWYMFRGFRQRTIALRLVYFSLPLTLWFFGGGWMLAGTVLQLLFMRQFDYSEKPFLPPTPSAGATSPNVVLAASPGAVSASGAKSSTNTASASLIASFKSFTSGTLP